MVKSARATMGGDGGRRSWVRRFVRAVRAGLKEAFGRPQPEMRDTDPAVMARLSPGLRRLVAQVRIAREALVGYIAEMNARPPSIRIRPGFRQIRDQTESLSYKAHQAAVEADAVLWDLVEVFEALPQADREMMRERGYTADRLRSLIDTSPQAAERYRPAPGPYREASTALGELEHAIMGAASR